MSTSQTQKAVVFKGVDKPLSIEQVPIPQAGPGSAVVKVLATMSTASINAVVKGKFPFPLVAPLIPGSAAVGRIHALGPDSTFFKVGQLVAIGLIVQSRDNPDASILKGFYGGQGGDGGEILMKGEWRNGTFAEYTLQPLEAIYLINEEVINKLGYPIANLPWLGAAFINAGGLMDIDLQAGDSLIVAPATGYFSGAGVQLALAMGARVIAAARNEQALARMAETYKSTGRLTTVKLTGDIPTDTAALKAASGSSKGADAYIDWSPGAAAKTTHIQACLAALKPFGKAVLMGGIFGNVDIPYWSLMRNSIRIQGRYMYDRHHALQVIKLLESGQLRIGPGECSDQEVKSFSLDDVEKSFAAAEEYHGGNKFVILEP